MTEQGVVLSVKNEFAMVRVGRNSACASCGKCGMTEKQKHVDFYARNSINAQIGDSVMLEIPETNSARLALVGYFIPVIPALCLLLLALGLHWADWLAGVLFLAGLAIGFAVVAIIDKLRRHKWMETPQIIQIIHYATATQPKECSEDIQDENEAENTDNNAIQIDEYQSDKEGENDNE